MFSHQTLTRLQCVINTHDLLGRLHEHLVLACALEKGQESSSLVGKLHSTQRPATMATAADSC